VGKGALFAPCPPILPSIHHASLAVGTLRFAHPTKLTKLTPAAPDQDQPDHRQRRAVPGPLHLADHETRSRPRDNAGALADPEQADQQGEDAEDEECRSYNPSSLI
jgi:hypothetical protein